MRWRLFALFLGFTLGVSLSSFAVTTNGGVFNAVRSTIRIDASGNTQVVLRYTNASTGRAATDRTLFIQPDTSKPILDEFGQVVNATTPSALVTAITTLLTQLDTSINTAGPAGKLDL